jgi:hypothetical protein
MCAEFITIRFFNIILLNQHIIYLAMLVPMPERRKWAIFTLSHKFTYDQLISNWLKSKLRYENN